MTTSNESAKSTETSGKAPTGKYRRRAIGLAIAAAVGGFLFGFDSSVVNGAVDAIQQDFALNAVVTGFVVAIALLGCALGAYLAGRLADRLGRLRVMLVGAILFLVELDRRGPRLLRLGPRLLARHRRSRHRHRLGRRSRLHRRDRAPAVRGSLASLQQLAITIGIFAALLSDALLAGVAGGGRRTSSGSALEAWRWMFLVGAIPAVIYGILAFTLPESPRYLDRQGPARRGAADLLDASFPRRTSTRRSPTSQKSIEEDEAGEKATLRGDRFGLKPIVWIGIILSVFQQFVGINVIFYYSTTLWKAVGFTESDSLTIR